MSNVSNKAEKKKSSSAKKGVVVRDGMDKTVVVEVVSLKTHPKYQKKIKVTKRYHVHDENNFHKVGETILFEECRPISKSKKWKTVEAETVKEEKVS